MSDEVKMTVTLSGAKYWKKNDKYHRLDGPAIIYPDGTKYWFQNGKQHRKDGPAFVYKSGKIGFYLNGQRLSFSDYLERIPKDIAEKVLIEWGHLL